MYRLMYCFTVDPVSCDISHKVAGFPQGLERLEKPLIWKNKFKAWNSLENDQIGLRALKIIKWALKILKFSKILKFPAMFAAPPPPGRLIVYIVFYLFLFFNL